MKKTGLFELWELSVEASTSITLASDASSHLVVLWRNGHSLGGNKVAQEQEIAHQLLGALLEATGSSESNSAWAVSERLVDSSGGGWCGPPCSSGRDLSTRRHVGGRLTQDISDVESRRNPRRGRLTTCQSG